MKSIGIPSMPMTVNGSRSNAPNLNDAETRRVVEKAKKGFYHTVDPIRDPQAVGIDMRWRTKDPVKSHYVGGLIHHLDNRTFDHLQTYYRESKRPLTVFVKRNLEEWRWMDIVNEYGISLVSRMKKTVVEPAPASISTES